MTEEETRIPRTGLWMLARMIARHQPAVKAAESAEANRKSEEAQVGAEVARGSGDQQ